ncbi:hypothetical protein [Paenibacillus sp. MBLB4367]|uniref:hypothetical protein n=1 Tax=Paenibacillus sp. MBLB4367 TaxID=3384767 RepID=UPI0039082B22
MGKCPYHTLTSVFPFFGKMKPQKQGSLAEQAQASEATLAAMPNSELADQIKMIALTIDDLRIMKAIQPLIEANIGIGGNESGIRRYFVLDGREFGRH